jgi:hypothetical protein
VIARGPSLSRGTERVRIWLPPAASLVRTCPARLRGRAARSAAAVDAPIETRDLLRSRLDAPHGRFPEDNDENPVTYPDNCCCTAHYRTSDRCCLSRRSDQSGQMGVFGAGAGSDANPLRDGEPAQNTVGTGWHDDKPYQVHQPRRDGRSLWRRERAQCRSLT